MAQKLVYFLSVRLLRECEGQSGLAGLVRPNGDILSTSTISGCVRLYSAFLGLGSLSTYARVCWVGCSLRLSFFASTAAIVLKGSTLRAVFGRGLASLGAALIISPLGITVLFALNLQDWVSVVADTSIEQAGRTAASLFGRLFAVNAIAMGLALGCLSLLIGIRLMQNRPKSLVSL